MKKPTKQQIIDAVIEDLKKNSFPYGDYTVLDELLNFVPEENLIKSLPEELWKVFETGKISKEDIVNVATSVGITLTEAEIEWVILCYEDAQRQDPSGTWNLVVEDLCHQAVEFRRESGPHHQLGYEQTQPEPGDSDYIEPDWSKYHTDGDGDDTLLNFMG